MALAIFQDYGSVRLLSMVDLSMRDDQQDSEQQEAADCTAEVRWLQNVRNHGFHVLEFRFLHPAVAARSSDHLEDRYYRGSFLESDMKGIQS